MLECSARSVVCDPTDLFVPKGGCFQCPEPGCEFKNTDLHAVYDHHDETHTDAATPFNDGTAKTCCYFGGTPCPQSIIFDTPSGLRRHVRDIHGMEMWW